QTITLTGTTSESVTLHIPDLLYIEAVGNYVKVYQWCDGQLRNDMLRATSKQMEDDLRPYPMIVRCHRAFLVNLQQVEQIISRSGAMQLVIKHCQETLPVSRSNTAQVKEAINRL
ncbi:MAG: LytTR family transcriptional regulator, partial [Muribaculaceae bacterium]|nr:LytTR family transcriptional regulator [Muribaculaceae bacterium]